MWKMSSKLVSLKKRCALISSASASLDPSRRTGSRVRSWRASETRRQPNYLQRNERGETHLLQDADAVLGHVDRVQRLVLQDGIKDLVLVVATERRLPEEHLVDEDSKRPPIDRTTVPLFENDLRREQFSAVEDGERGDAPREP